MWLVGFISQADYRRRSGGRTVGQAVALCCWASCFAVAAASPRHPSPSTWPARRAQNGGDALRQLVSLPPACFRCGGGIRRRPAGKADWMVTLPSSFGQRHAMGRFLRLLEMSPHRWNRLLLHGGRLLRGAAQLLLLRLHYPSTTQRVWPRLASRACKMMMRRHGSSDNSGSLLWHSCW